MADITLGRLREDGSGHWYLIPKYKAEKFDELLIELDGTVFESDEYYDVLERFEELCSTYRLDGGVEELDVVMGDCE